MLIMAHIHDAHLGYDLRQPAPGLRARSGDAKRSLRRRSEATASCHKGWSRARRPAHVARDEDAALDEGADSWSSPGRKTPFIGHSLRRTPFTKHHLPQRST